METEVVTSINGPRADQVRLLMDRALDLDLHDDRFDRWPTANPALAPLAQPGAPAPEVVACLARRGEDLVGYLGGPAPGGDHPNPTVTLDALGLDDPQARATLGAMIDAVGPALPETARVELWARPARSWHQELAHHRGLTEIRALHQMRGALPARIEPVPSRALRPNDDGDLINLCQVNNRAFHTHPDQGNQTVESLRATMAEPWFDPEGLRLHERDGRLVGFCWTKIHQPRPSVRRPQATSPALGEIYVIGVDPDFHGQGLGGPMTAAGLAWLHQQGLTTGMLYVEADNTPAVRTYRRLGFSVARTDQAWLL